MASTPAGTASADLLASLLSPNKVQFLDSPMKRRAFFTTQDASSQGRSLPPQAQDLRIADHGSQLPKTVARLATNGKPTLLQQKRKCEDVSSLCPQEHQNGVVSDLDPCNTHSTVARSSSKSHLTRTSSAKAFRSKRPKKDELSPASWTRTHKDSDPLTLPAEVWHYILCLVPPISLVRLLRVSRMYRGCLDEAHAGEAQPLVPNSIAQPMKAESIWFASRKRFYPGLPRTLGDLSELALWRLLHGSTCQTCGKSKTAHTPINVNSLWETGPGANGIRIIWPFGIRTCAACLKDVTETELDLLLSSDCPSVLLPGLPFAFISNEKHFITHTAMRSSPALPPSLILIKCYYKPHIENIKRQFKDAQDLGGASAEEWIKGLPKQGQQHIVGTMPWENYEAKGGLKKLNDPPQPKRSISGEATIEGQASSLVIATGIPLPRTDPCTLAPPSIPGGSSGIYMQPKPLDSAFSRSEVARPHHPALDAFNPFANQAYFGQPISSHQLHQLRPERNLREVNEAKAARRADIERRCASLDPPIPLNLLDLMESFQAALQITQPMTDPAWQMLKPRILAQVPCAERRAKDQADNANLKSEESKERRRQVSLLKESKYESGRDWENLQGYIKDRIRALADDIINTRWSKGKSITKENAPNFAADVLVQVRKRFYTNTTKDEVSLASGEIRKADLSNGSPMPILLLDNMKWIFDNKIKPLADHYRRELFLCSVCASNMKFYGFEGVIQHFAAKHTTKLSMGNVVVHWRAEWPEHPPFHPNPSPAVSAMHKIPKSVTSSGPYASSTDLARTGIYGTYLPGVDSGFQTSNFQGVAASSISQPMPAASTALPAYFYSSTTDAPRQQGISINYDVNAAQPWQTALIHGPPYSGPHTYPSGALLSNEPFLEGLPKESLCTSVHQSPVPYPPSYSSDLSLNRADLTMPTRSLDSYEQQVEEMARHAKEVFLGLGGVKGLPGSVRVFTTIQHMIIRFKMTFADEPTLQMFINGLDHNATMRPVRSVNGIACKICVTEGTMAGVGPQNHGKIVGDRRLYTLPHLVNHFKSSHVEVCQIMGPPQSTVESSCDWKNDMIQLPEASLISGLANAPGMTDFKTALISAALPDAFTRPCSKLDIDSETQYLPSESVNGRNTYTSLTQKPSEKTIRDEEYDPLRPGLSYESVKTGPNVDLPANDAGAAIPYRGLQPSGTGFNEGYRSKTHSSHYDRLFNGNNSPRDTSSNGQNASSHTIQAASKVISPPPFNDERKRYGSPRTVAQPRSKIPDRTEYFSKPEAKSAHEIIQIRDSRGLQSARHEKPVNGVLNQNEAADRFLCDLGSNYHQSSPDISRTMDQERYEEHQQSLGLTETRSESRKERDQRKSVANLPKSRTPQRYSTTTEEHGTPVYPGSLSQIPPYEDADLSSRERMPHRLAGSFEHCKPVIQTRALRSETQPYKASMVSQYRGRSRSPPCEISESTRYRTRTPVEEDRGQSVQHLWDAPLFRRKAVESQYQTLVKYPPSRAEDHHSIRVPEEYSQYVMAQPEERIMQSEFLYFEPADTSEPFCKISERLIPASQVRYVEAPSRAVTSYSQEYQC